MSCNRCNTAHVLCNRKVSEWRRSFWASSHLRVRSVAHQNPETPPRFQKQFLDGKIFSDPKMRLFGDMFPETIFSSGFKTHGYFQKLVWPSFSRGNRSSGNSVYICVCIEHPMETGALYPLPCLADDLNPKSSSFFIIQLLLYYFFSGKGGDRRS